jgi:hypothetical protein
MGEGDERAFLPWCECASALLTVNAVSKLSLFLPCAKRSRQPAGCEFTLVGEVNVYVFYEHEYKGMHLQSFTVSEKPRIVREAEEIGNRAAGRKYNVPESCIRDWREKKEMLLKSSGTRRAFRGQKAFF